MEKDFDVIEEKAKKYFRDECDTIHIKTARELGENLILKEGGKERIIIPAIILHDTGWYKFSYDEEKKARKIGVHLNDIALNHKHEEESASLAEGILKELGWENEELQEIKEIIMWHDTRTKPISLNDMIVKDADRLSRYTPKFLKTFCEKFNYDQDEFATYIKSQIEKWLFTDTGKYLARKYSLLRELEIPIEEEPIAKFLDILIKLEGSVIKKTKEYGEKLAIALSKEKVYSLKREIELYLKDKDYVDVSQLQRDDKFKEIVSQPVGKDGYIGIIDRETRMIIFHPDPEIINIEPEEIEKRKRPDKFLHGFWNWHKRAYAGEEFYDYYQGMNINNEVVDKFQYCLPVDIKKIKLAIVAAACYEDFFDEINIISSDVISSISCFSKDMTNIMKSLRDAQDELVKKERLAIIGQLASGVSHDLRNPLAVIKNTSYLLKTHFLKPKPKIKRILDILEHQVIISERIIDNLLCFAKSIPPVFKEANLSLLIKDSLSHTIIPNVIKIRTLLDDKLKIIGDPDQLNRVFINIISNGIQSMHEQGELLIEGKVINNEVFISFKDTGCGIQEKDKNKIFEPFFTTKAKGIGLGLAIVKNILAAHNGNIEVESIEEKGTTFTITLPLRFRNEKNKGFSSR